MHDHLRHHPRKLPVVLQIRQMAERKRASEKVVSALVGWSGRQLAMIAAIPVVSLALYVGWQLTGEPTDDALLNLSAPTSLERESFTSETISAAAPATVPSTADIVETASYDSPVDAFDGPQFPSPQGGMMPHGGDAPSPNASRRAQISSVNSMPAAHFQQAERNGNMTR